MNIKKLLLLASPRQFAEWSLPSKVGYVSFWIGLVGLMITIGTSYPMIEKYFQPSENAIRTRLTTMLNEKRFADAEDLLSRIESRDDLKDTYYFFKGTFAIESHAPTPAEPRAFFRKINPDSELFETAVQNERAYYSRRYAATDKSLYYKNVGAMLDEVAALGWLTPAYYSMRVMVDSNSEGAYQRLAHWYYEFDNKYSKYLDKSTYDGFMFSTSGGPNSNFRLKPNHQPLVLVPEVYFHFAVELALKSGSLCEHITEKKIALGIMRNALAARLGSGRPTIIQSLQQHLHIGYRPQEIEFLIQWLASMDRYCEPNPSLQGTLRQKAAQRP